MADLAHVARPWSAELIPADHLPPWGSAAFVYGVGLLGFAAAVTFAVTRSLVYRRRARLARDSFRADAPLLPGKMVLHGEVAHAHGASVAVRVEIEQEGKEHTSEGNQYVIWTEQQRRIEARPFYVIDASGRRIRVEPGDDVLLFSDQLSAGARIGPTRRRRVAELVPGQRVFASGEITLGKDPENTPAGYRDQGGAPILRRPRGESMVLSTEPLGQSLAARARLHHWAALVILLAGAVLNCAVFRSYYILALDGVPTRATITKLATVHSHNSEDGTDTTHYRASLSIPERGIAIDENMTSADFERMRVGETIPAWYAASYPKIVAVGYRPTIEAGLAFFVVVSLGVGACLYTWAHRKTLRWYEKRSVLVDQEPGCLV